MTTTLYERNLGNVHLLVTAEPDEYPDLSWMGEYSDIPNEYAISTGRDGKFFRWFNPLFENYLGIPKNEIAKYCQQDFERMEAYNNGAWSLLVISAKLSVHDKEIGSDSLGGIESDAGEYLQEIIREVAHCAIHDARTFLNKLAGAELLQTLDHQGIV